jgi:hypothetical protein
MNLPSGAGTARPRLFLPTNRGRRRRKESLIRRGKYMRLLTSSPTPNGSWSPCAPNIWDCGLSLSMNLPSGAGTARPRLTKRGAALEKDRDPAQNLIPTTEDL